MNFGPFLNLFSISLTFAFLFYSVQADGSDPRHTTNIPAFLPVNDLEYRELPTSAPRLLTEDEINDYDSTMRVFNVIKSGLNLASVIAQLIDPFNPGPFCSVALTNLFDYYRYIDLSNSEKLQYIFNHQDQIGNSFKFLPDFGKNIQAQFNQRESLTIFQQYNLQPSFFINFWESLLALLICCAVLGFVLVLNLGVKHCLRLGPIFGRIIVTLKWNFTVMLFVTFYTQMAFFSSLEFRTFSPDGFLEIFSFIFCVLVSSHALWIFAKVILVIRQLRKSLTKDSPLINKKLEDYQVIFKANGASIPEIIFLPLIIAQTFCIGMIIGYLFAYPVLQSSFLVALSTLITLYSVKINMFKEWIDYLQFILQQVALMMIHLCFLVTAVLDEREYDDPLVRNNLGNVIVYAEVARTALTLTYCALRILIACKIAYEHLVTKFSKNEKQARKKSKSNVNFFEKFRKSKKSKYAENKLQSLPNPEEREVESPSHLELKINITRQDTPSAELLPANQTRHISIHEVNRAFKAMFRPLSSKEATNRYDGKPRES